MTKERDTVSEAMIEAGQGAWLDHRGYSDADALRAIYLAMQSAREPKPAAPPIGDVEAMARAIHKAKSDSPYPWFHSNPDKCVMSRHLAAAALATQQPADPGGTWLAEIAAKNSERVSTMPASIASQPFSADPVEPKVSSDVVTSGRVTAFDDETFEQVQATFGSFVYLAQAGDMITMEPATFERIASAFATLRASDPKVSSDVVIEIERLIRLAMQDEFLLGQNADDRMERRYATASKAAAAIATLRASDPSRELVEARVVIKLAASLAAAISLLERGGKAAKKAAPSDKMFDQMLVDYRKTLDDARAALNDTKGEGCD